MTINTALIAEYLWLGHHLPDDPNAPAYEHANRIAWQLMMDVPTDVWRLIIRTFQPKSVSGVDVGEAIADVIVAARYFNGMGREVTSAEWAHHAPGIGLPKDAPTPGEPGSNVTFLPVVPRPHAAPSPPQPEPPASPVPEPQLEPPPQP